MDNRKVKPEKFILDATAGYRMMWINKQHPNCIYLDEREEVNPDIVGDFRDLKKFKNETFRLVLFDPPHSIHSEASAKAFGMLDSYGCLKPETWSSDLKLGLKECWRVLKPYGVLIFKWNETDKSIKQISQYFPTKPLFGQITNTSKRRNSQLGGTYWFCFMKILEENKK